MKVDLDESSSHAVSASQRGLLTIKVVAPLVCEVEYTLGLERTNSIPDFMTNARALELVRSLLGDLQSKSERNGVRVDEELRAALPPLPPIGELPPDAHGIYERCSELEGGAYTKSPSARAAPVEVSAFQSRAATLGIGRRLSRRMSKQESESVPSSVSERKWRKVWSPCAPPPPQPPPPPPPTNVSPSLADVDLLVNSNPPAQRSGWPGRTVPLGRCQTRIDLSAGNAAAWWFMYTGRHRVKSGKARGSDVARVEVSRRSPHDITYASVKKFAFPHKDRHFYVRTVIAEDMSWTSRGDVVVCAESEPKHEPYDFGKSLQFVVGKLRAICRFSPVPGHESTQCRVSFTQYLDPCGMLPVWTLSGRLNQKMARSVERLRALYKSDQVRHKELLEATEMGIVESEALNPDEADFLAGTMNAVDDVETTATLRKIESPDPLVGMQHASVPDVSHGLLVGDVVVDATPETCLAWEIERFDRLTSGNKKRNVVMHRKQTIGVHDSVFYLLVDAGIPGTRLREFVTRQVWQRNADGDGNLLELVNASVERPECVRERSERAQRGASGSGAQRTSFFVLASEREGELAAAAPKGHPSLCSLASAKGS
jgi:hypothetical protein